MLSKVSTGCDFIYSGKNGLHLRFGFRYDIFTRAAFVILKDGGSPVTAKKCKFCASMQSNHKPTTVLQSREHVCTDCPIS